MREVRREIEKGRTLPAALINMMTEVGFLPAMGVFRAFGSPKLTFAEFLPVIEELSGPDGSVRWCATVAAVRG